MKTEWVKGLDKDEKAEIQAAFKSSIALRARLIGMLEGKISSVDSSMTSKEGYNCPNWPYKMADSIAAKRAFKEVISLLS